MLIPTLLTVGCYSYVPLQAAPTPGVEARVRLTDLGSATLAPLLGAGVVAIRGRLVESNDQSLTLAVVGVTNRQDLEDPWLGERVVVKREFVSGFERRDFNAGKSTMLAAGMLLGGVVLFAGIKLGGDLAGGRNPGGGQTR